MTVTNSTSRKTHAATVGDTVISLGYEVQRSDDVRGYLTPSGGSPTLLVEGTHYTVSELGEPFAQITLVTAAAAGDVYNFFRVLDILQELNLRNQGAYFPETLETSGLDRIVMMLLQLENIVSSVDPSLARALLLGITDVIGSGAYDALSNRIANMDDATGQQDAVTLKQLQAAVAGVVGGVSGTTRIVVTAATLPAASVTYDFVATGIEYVVRDAAAPDVIKRCLRLSTGTTYDWFVVVQGDR